MMSEASCEVGGRTAARPIVTPRVLRAPGSTATSAIFVRLTF